METAEHSLDVANRVKNVSPFLDLNSARQIVRWYVPDVDQFRVNDIAKMLYTSAKKLHLNATLSDEAIAYVDTENEKYETYNIYVSSRKGFTCNWGFI